MSSTTTRSGPLLGKLVCAAPLLCAVHCLAAPLLIVVSPALAPTPATEWGLLVVAVVIGGLVLFRGAAHHGCWRMLAVGILAIFLWALGLLGALAPLPEAATTLLGTLGLAGAMGSDLRRRHSESALAETGRFCDHHPRAGIRTGHNL